MELTLQHGDITVLHVDAIVNAANSGLGGGGGVDGAIHRAGGPTIAQECRRLRQTEKYRRGLPAGQSVATAAGNLAAHWVIHTVGPIYQPAIDQAEILRSCYLTSLAVADELGAKTVAFPLISAGAYGWPRRDAIKQALDALRHADTSVQHSVLVLFDLATFELAQDVLGEEKGPCRLSEFWRP